jgi:hypothetical protein
MSAVVVGLLLAGVSLGIMAHGMQTLSLAKYTAGLFLLIVSCSVVGFGIFRWLS